MSAPDPDVTSFGELGARRTVPDLELAHGAPFPAQLNAIIGLAHVALAALGDEHEGAFRQAVEDLDVLASRLCDAVGDM